MEFTKENERQISWNNSEENCRRLSGKFKFDKRKKNFGNFSTKGTRGRKFSINEKIFLWSFSKLQPLYTPQSLNVLIDIEKKRQKCRLRIENRLKCLQGYFQH